MTKLTKEQALEKIEELKKYVDEVDTKVEKTVGIALKSRHGNIGVIYQSTKTILKEAVEEAVQSCADLIGANLYGANLYGAELQDAKFYGQGGSVHLTRSQLPDFLAALGFILED